MPGYFSVMAKNYMLDQLGTNKALYISAHTADPGPTGANECAGSTRQAVTWNAASGGTKTQSNAPLIPGISVSDAVAYLGLFDGVSSTGATHFVGKVQVTVAAATGSGTWSYQVVAGTIDLNAVASA